MFVAVVCCSLWFVVTRCLNCVVCCLLYVLACVGCCVLSVVVVVCCLLFIVGC